MHAIYTLVYLVGQILIWMLIIWTVLGLLVNFNVINAYNPFVQTVMRSLDGLFEPMLRPIRRFLPSAKGIDFSPMVLIIIIYVLQALLLKDILPALM